MIKLHIDKERHFIKGSILDPDFGYWVDYDRIVFYNVYMNNKKIGLVQNYYKGENLLSVSRPYFWEPSQDAFKAGREHSLHTAIKKLVYLVSWRDKHLIKEESTDNTENDNYKITRVEKNYPVPRHLYSIKWDKQIKYEIYFGSRNLGYVTTYFLNNEMLGSPHGYLYTYFDENSQVVDYGSFSSLKLAIQHLIKKFENDNKPDTVEESTDNTQNDNYKVNRVEKKYSVPKQFGTMKWDKMVYYEIYFGSKKLGSVTTYFLNNEILYLPAGYVYPYIANSKDVSYNSSFPSLKLAIQHLIKQFEDVSKPDTVEESTDDTQNDNYKVNRVELTHEKVQGGFRVGDGWIDWDKEVYYEIYFGSKKLGYITTLFLNNVMLDLPKGSYLYNNINAKNKPVNVNSAHSLNLAIQNVIKYHKRRNKTKPVEESTDDNTQNNNYRVNRVEVNHERALARYRDGILIHFDKQVNYQIYFGSKKLGYVTTLFLNNAMLDLPEGSYLYKYYGPIDVRYDPFSLKAAQSLNLAIQNIIKKYHKSLYKTKPVKENASNNFSDTTTASVSTQIISAHTTLKPVIEKIITIKRNGITLGKVTCHYNMDNTIHTGMFNYPNFFKWDAWLIDKQLYLAGYVDSLPKAIKKILNFHKNPHDELNEASETSGNYHVERDSDNWGNTFYHIYKTTKKQGSSAIINNKLGIVTYNTENNLWSCNVIDSKNMYYGLGFCKNLNTCIAKVIDWHKEFDSVTLSSPNITIKQLETKKVLRGNERVDQTTEGVYYKNTLIGKIIKTDIADEPYFWKVMLENRILYGREREGSADTKERALYRILSWHHGQVTFQDMQATT